MDLRKIDALIYVHVFGNDFVTVEDAVETVGVPRYSADIAAAWEVWEKLREDGPGNGDYFCCMDLRWPVAEGYEVALRRGNHDEDHAGKAFVLVSQVRTAPLAICLAALKARGITVE